MGRVRGWEGREGAWGIARKEVKMENEAVAYKSVKSFSWKRHMIKSLDCTTRNTH